MRAVVFAYHNMGVIGLKALRRHGVDVRLVVSHEDDPREECWFASVRDYCASHGIACVCPADVNRDEWIARIAACRPDMLWAFYYRRLLCDAVLATAPRGGVNLHGSLLPAYRGRCPANWVLVRGESTTGVTLHHMIARADAGDIIGRERVAVTPGDDIVTLYAKLAEAARGLLNRLIPLLVAGTAPRYPQDERAASTFGRRTPADGLIDWGRSARSQHNLVRAVTAPYPGAFSFMRGRRLTVWRAEPEVVGTPLAQGELHVNQSAVCVGCGSDALRLHEITWDGVRWGGDEVRQALVQYDGVRLGGGD